MTMHNAQCGDVTFPPLSFSKHGNMYTKPATYKLAINKRVSNSVLLSNLYLFIFILIEFLNYELSTIFTMVLYQCIFSLDIFISFSEASGLIT